MGVSKFLCVLLVLLGVACAPTDLTYKIRSADGKETTVVPTYFDDRWSDSERATLKLAIEEWNTALAGHLVMKVVDETYHVDMKNRDNDPGYMFIKIDSNNPLVEKEEQFISLAFTHGRGRGVGGNRIYFIADRFSNWDLLPIARHEIGHMLGAPHAEESHEVLMSPRFNIRLYNCVDRDAVLVVAKYRHLSVDGMSWCEKH